MMDFNDLMVMQQLSLFDQKTLNQITNVSSVPQRSPFRYPGGKTWLVPRIRQWLNSLPNSPEEFIEPFAGGGIVSLTVAFEQLASHVTMVELDEQVAAVWQTILNGDADWLANQIIRFEMSADAVAELLSNEPRSLKYKAFQTIVKNRVNRGGILAPGAGMIKQGEKGKGLKSRWYPETLKRRILQIAEIRDRITFIQGDGLEILTQNINRPDAVFFIDPPYTAAGKKAGKRLYNYAHLNHDELFKIARKTTGNFLMTYDNTQEVKAWAKDYGFDWQAVAMKNTHHAKMTELLIGRNLDWF
jgi:DNA adenine methylase